MADPAADPSPTRVLLIDDSPVVLDTVGALIESWGNEVVTAEHADGGLAALDSGPFDIVVADVNMPGMDGLALLAAIRSRAPELPVIMLSSATEISIVLQAIHAGAFDYVNKDDGLEALGSAVQRALEHVRLVRENRRLVDELRGMNVSLEEKVRERTVELEQVNRRLSEERNELERTLGALRHAQGQLIQAEKMATIGLFTAGIAHEINNPLAFLLPDFEEVERWVAAFRDGRDPAEVMEPEELEQLLRDCRHGLLRIGRIVKQVSVFAHQSAQEIGRVDVAPLVGTAFRMLEKEAQRMQAELATRVDPTAAVRGNSDQLQQVLFNLVLNAVQSLDPRSSGGRIEVDARQHGGDVVISVSDNGRGISSGNLERVFEPFFTTKGVGEGTGLGLSISRRLVQRMGGRLELASRPGQGTTAYLVLPAWAPVELPAEAAVEDTGEHLAMPEPTGRRLTVVVIDDETALLQALKRLLADEHDVVTFADPVEAKEWLLYGPQADVVLCDIMMPVMSGLDLYQEVTHAHPWLASRFVFISGVTRAREIQKSLASDLRILEKPLLREQLLAICREVGPRGARTAA